MNRKDLIIWFAEYLYYKVNPDSKMDVPSIVYEQIERDFNKKFSTQDPHKNCISKSVLEREILSISNFDPPNSTWSKHDVMELLTTLLKK